MSKILIWLYISDNKAFQISKESLELLVNRYGNRYSIETVEDQKSFINKLSDADIVMTWFFRREWYLEAKKLKYIFTPPAGKEWVEEDKNSKVKIIHGNFHGKIIRESLLSMMLYFNNRLDKAIIQQKEKLWEPKTFSGLSTLRDQTVLLVGYGSIGRICAEILKPLGCKIIGVKRTIKLEQDDIADKLITFIELDGYLSEADHVVMLLPGGEATTNIFTSDYFSLMKETACFYNFGRGNCYKEDDLISVLKRKKIKFAGLDVFEIEPLPYSSDLWKLDNVIITPHVGAVRREYVDFFIRQIVDADVI